MAKQRNIDVKFWDDQFIRSLKPNEKYLWLYLLTNSLTSLCGVYEITLERISFDTGLSLKIIRECFTKYEKHYKIHYIDGWVFIKNYEKHQSSNPNMKEGAKRELSLVPEKIRLKIDHIETLTQPFESLRKPPLLNLTLPNLTLPNLTSVEEGFEKLWEINPKKIGKVEALKSWKKLSVSDRQAALENLPRHAASPQWQKENGKYIPHLATWLNQRRWEDELEVALPPPGKSEWQKQFDEILRLNAERDELDQRKN